ATFSSSPNLFSTTPSFLPQSSGYICHIATSNRQIISKTEEATPKAAVGVDVLEIICLFDVAIWQI
ncbi:MAG: hypothetical protein LE180_01430, partial [Endomicrobium sp.]|uniref:hypothetical protein n=1 Tax=Candidatus Endomicrobiellum pyrsonymphae TaxID=1408203 RepID=UPI003578007B|nr:hypothetical protein [Endomicrobium sp.]